MRISDWSSDVCSSDLPHTGVNEKPGHTVSKNDSQQESKSRKRLISAGRLATCAIGTIQSDLRQSGAGNAAFEPSRLRSEAHTSELQSLMRISYAVLCLKKKHINTTIQQHTRTTTRK